MTTQAEQAKEIEALRQELAARDAELFELKEESEGWLIVTPQPDYEGEMYGLRFEFGHCFIPRKMIVPAFTLQPMNPSQMARYLDLQYPKPTYTDEERAAVAAGIREREQIPSAERAAQAIASDFGYKVEFFGAERLHELGSRRKELAKAARRLIEEAAVTAQQTSLVMPGYMNR